ncbi:hypothetical protein [Paraburkholderia tropica]|uniref:hypothetical protein n=1 Tax=Paraburkholderia tropica TaxID=92647 RepID=UPI002AB77BB0|nr:hypothetical protein [Paraburkholderia tropica]
MTTIVALIGTASTLLAVIITSRTQVRNQRENNLFQFDLAKEKSKSDFSSKLYDSASVQLITAHKLLSHIGREFSITEIVIMRRSAILKSEFDEKYKLLCEKVDELRMIADFYAPESAPTCEEIYRQMSSFWGNFSTVLHLTEEGRAVDHRDDCFQKAHEAAMEIGKKVEFAKYCIKDSFRSHLATR